MKNKNVLIVGAGGLLGTSVAKYLFDAGASLVCADIEPQAMQKRLLSSGLTPGERISLVELDVTNESQVKDFFQKSNELDGAVNATYPRNSQYGAHFYDVTLESFNANLSLHLGSAFLFMQQCAAWFEKYQRPFSLVNISSIYGVVAPKFDVYDGTAMTMPVEYAAIKSAIIHLNRYVASYVKDSNFRVNSVSPGGIFDHQPEQFLTRYRDNTLGKGMLEKQDLCGAIKFLLSDDARYINGQNLIVDDGFSL